MPFIRLTVSRSSMDTADIKNICCPSYIHSAIHIDVVA